MNIIIMHHLNYASVAGAPEVHVYGSRCVCVCVIPQNTICIFPTIAKNGN